MTSQRVILHREIKSGVLQSATGAGLARSLDHVIPYYSYSYAGAAHVHARTGMKARLHAQHGRARVEQEPGGLNCFW